MTVRAPCKALTGVSAFLLGATLALRTASADPTSTETDAHAVIPSRDVAGDPATLAQRYYEEGAAAYADNDHARAIQRFLEADRLKPSPALSFNIARGYEKIGDVAQALRFYREYLRRAPKADDAKRVTQHIRSLELRLSQQGLQQLTVSSIPPGAMVWVDGQKVGPSPTTSEHAPGEHRLTLQLKGYRSRNVAFVLPADRSLDMKPALTREAPEHAPSAAKAPQRLRYTPMPAPARDDKGNGSRSLRTWGFIGMGAGGAALATALTYEIMRRNAERDAKNATTQIDYAEDMEKAKSRKEKATIFAGTGTALFLAGGALLSIDLLSKKKNDPYHNQKVSRISLDCGMRGCNASWKGKF